MINLHIVKDVSRWKTNLLISAFRRGQMSCYMRDSMVMKFTMLLPHIFILVPLWRLKWVKSPSWFLITSQMGLKFKKGSRYMTDCQHTLILWGIMVCNLVITCLNKCFEVLFSVYSIKNVYFWSSEVVVIYQYLLHEWFFLFKCLIMKLFL